MKWKSKRISRTCNPVWEEEFTYDHKGKFSDLGDELTLVIDVWDYDFGMVSWEEEVKGRGSLD
jgi:hypothetical protein